MIRRSVTTGSARVPVLAAGVMVALGLVGAPGAGQAQAVGESRAAIFLTLPTSARALALGDAWSAAADDENALFFNPAQLARVRGFAVGGSVQQYVASTTLGAFALATPVAGGTLAVGLQLLDYGSVDEIVPADGSFGQQGVPTGATVSAQDLAVSGGYGLALGPGGRLRLGAAVKVARQQIASYAGNALAADVGAAYTLPGGWDVAASLQHLGTRLKLAAVTAPLPWTWRASVAAPSLVHGRFRLRPMAEVRQPSGGVATGVFAAEGGWQSSAGGPALALRAGYAVRGSGDDRSPLTLGGGVTLGRVSVDYAYEGFDLMGGATHRVGVRFTAAPLHR